MFSGLGALVFCIQYSPGICNGKRCIDRETCLVGCWKPFSMSGHFFKLSYTRHGDIVVHFKFGDATRVSPAKGPPGCPRDELANAEKRPWED